MDQKQLREQEAKCVQENPPGCTAGCPVHVDVRGMVEAIRKEDYAAGFALLQRMIPFPGIISRICSQPCRQQCKRAEVDEAIFIRGLEKICVDNYPKERKVSLLPAKAQKVAVVGAGLSGLTVAFELGRKGYQVTVFEANDRVGGSVWEIPEQQLPRPVMQEDFAVFEKIPVTLFFNTYVTSLDELCEQYDAIYIGTGKSVEVAGTFQLEAKQGKLSLDRVSLATSRDKVFAGGSLRQEMGEKSGVFSIADGKIAANSIDRLLQNASLTANREKEGSFETALYTNIEGVSPEPMVVPMNSSQGYSTAEGAREAKRCLVCECLECVKACEYLAHYRAYPKRYVREVYNNLSIVMGIRHANKMINSCSLCGLCEKICPSNLNMGQILQEARKEMVRKGKMPPSAHEFALRDMQYSNSESCTLARHQPGIQTSEWLFYPGCQLSATAPEQVQQTYRFLCEKLKGGVGLLLGCCGAPASWAGQEDLFQETLQRVWDNWQEMGEPKLITACPTCYSLFKERLSDVPVESLWALLVNIGLPEAKAREEIPSKLAIHDSCTTRYETEFHNSVRKLLGEMNYQWEELPHSRENTQCCGYGGLMLYVNQEVTDKVIQRRSKESELDYLTYCAMCRDNFARRGKEAYHLLDLIFSDSRNRRIVNTGVGYSERQQNRARLKINMQKEVWGEQVEEASKGIEVTVPDSVLKVMETRRILVEDVKAVIANAEQTGSKFKNVESGHFVAYYRPDNVTYWVEYSVLEESFIVHNAYCHRLEITK